MGTTQLVTQFRSLQQAQILMNCEHLHSARDMLSTYVTSKFKKKMILKKRDEAKQKRAHENI